MYAKALAQRLACVSYSKNTELKITKQKGKKGGRGGEGRKEGKGSGRGEKKNHIPAAAA